MTSGTKTCDAVASATSSTVLRPSLEAAMSRKTTSSMPVGLVASGHLDGVAEVLEVLEPRPFDRAAVSHVEADDEPRARHQPTSQVTVPLVEKTEPRLGHRLAQREADGLHRRLGDVVGVLATHDDDVQRRVRGGREAAQHVVVGGVRQRAAPEPPAAEVDRGGHERVVHRDRRRCRSARRPRGGLEDRAARA